MVQDDDMLFSDYEEELTLEELDLESNAYTLVESMEDFSVDPDEWDWSDEPWPPEYEVVKHFDSEEELIDYFKDLGYLESVVAIYNYAEDITDKCLRKLSQLLDIDIDL